MSVAALDSTSNGVSIASSTVCWGGGYFSDHDARKRQSIDFPLFEQQHQPEKSMKPTHRHTQLKNVNTVGSSAQLTDSAICTRMRKSQLCAVGCIELRNSNLFDLVLFCCCQLLFAAAADRKESRPAL